MRGEAAFTLTTEGKGLPQGGLKRAPKQAALLAALQTQAHLTRAQLEQLEIPRSIATTLIDKGLVKIITLTADALALPATLLREASLRLGDEQQQAFDRSGLR